METYDGATDWITALLIVSFFSLLPLAVAIFFVVLNRRNFNHFIQEKHFMEQQIENQLLKSKVEIQEHTLTQICREIHDNIGQVLGLIKLNLYSAMNTYKDEKLIEAHTLIGEAISDLRNLNKTFNPQFVHQEGLMRAIAHEVGIIRRSGRYDIRFEQEGDADFIKGEKEVILFRMIQESIQNVLKHAQATTIEIKAKADMDTAMFSVSDNGKGFYINLPDVKGFGLTNLEERARLIDADLEIFSYPGAGTNVIIHIKDNG